MRVVPVVVDSVQPEPELHRDGHADSLEERRAAPGIHGSQADARSRQASEWLLGGCCVVASAAIREAPAATQTTQTVAVGDGPRCRFGAGRALFPFRP